jgi:hypothetical protein
MQLFQFLNPWGGGYQPMSLGGKKYEKGKENRGKM